MAERINRASLLGLKKAIKLQQLIFAIAAMRRDVDTLQKLDAMLYAIVLLSGKFHDSRFAAGSQSLSQHVRSINL